MKIPTTESVMVVTSYVPLVKKLLIVPFVKETDTQFQLAHVQMDTSKLGILYVQNVLINVILVLDPKITVLIVLKTESTYQFVTVHTVSITLITKLTVQPVTKNVLLVSKPLITVASVLKD